MHVYLGLFVYLISFQWNWCECECKKARRKKKKKKKKKRKPGELLPPSRPFPPNSHRFFLTQKKIQHFRYSTLLWHGHSI